MKLFHKKYIVIILVLIQLSCQKSENNSKEAIFNSDRAYSILEEFLKIGPRVPGTDTHLKAKDFLFNFLKKQTDFCKTQEGKGYNPFAQDSVKLANIIASFNENQSNRVLLCAHWDSRPVADNDPDTNYRNLPILGANDAGGAVAILLHIAELINRAEFDFGIDIILFDGEDLGQHFSNTHWLQGSKLFVKENPDYKPQWGILLDLCTEKDLKIKKEMYSYYYARWLVDKIWNIAYELGLDIFSNEIGSPVYDDHINFLYIKIPVIDIIDIQYKQWHTHLDDINQISKENMGKVGGLVLECLKRYNSGNW